jgi:hypothetical protein
MIKTIVLQAKLNCGAKVTVLLLNQKDCAASMIQPEIKKASIHEASCFS